MILITGANGQLGTELRYLLDERNVDYVAVDVAEMDITNSEQHYIIRTAWVFGNYGKNFVFTMQNLAKSHKALTVVNDQHGRPT